MPSNSLIKYIRYIPSQHNIDCCTSSSVLLAAEIIMSTNGQYILFSRLYLYYMTRMLHNGLFTKGAHLRDTLSTLSKYGCAVDSDWPFISAFADIEPYPYIIAKAVDYKLFSSESIHLSEIKTYIDKNTPVIIGIAVGTLFWQISGKMNTHRYMPVDGTLNLQTRGHSVVIVGYDDDLNGGSWIIANSLGPTWGEHGYAAIPYYCNIDIGEAYVINNFAGFTPI